jgi:hypothetical protein
MTAWARSAVDRSARTLLPRPEDMASRLRASASASRWAGVSPAAWAARTWAAITSITAVEFLARGATASAGSVSESAK